MAADDQDQESWEVYPSQLDQHFAMFSVNVAPADSAPFDNLPWLNIVRITGFETNPSGMPASADINSQLYSIEDRISETARARGALLVGRLTVAGRRELFLYSASAIVEPLVEIATAEFRGQLQFEGFVREDPLWSAYQEFLYPSPIDWQRIQNQKLVQLLRNEGDDLSAPRQIDHFAYFPDDAARTEFVGKLDADVFTVDSQSEDQDRGELSFVLSFHSVGPADLGSIDQTTIPLAISALEVGGNYDGWGCEVNR